MTKMPRFPFDKFTDANQKLGTQMKATGEVMGVGRTFEESLLKAVRSLETGVNYLYMPKFDKMAIEELSEYIKWGTDDRIFAIAQLLRMGATVCQISKATRIDRFFLEKIKNIVEEEKKAAYASRRATVFVWGEKNGILGSGDSMVLGTKRTGCL